MCLHERSDQELLSDIGMLLGSHRELTAKLVAHLAEVEDRRLHLLLGFSSMFDFCQKKLGMSEGEAFRRILAARLGRRFPIVCSLLASGEVNLSTLELLRPSLTDENHQELFAAVAGMSKRELQSFLSERFPQPDGRSSIRRTTIEPLGKGTFRVQFTASDSLREKLELCRDLMSHTNPSRELAFVIERGVDLLLAHLEKRRLGKATRPRRISNDRKGKPRGIANATRREVYERDGLQCTYVAEDGRRCEARAFLELDHVVARAHGGSNEARNLRVRCQSHNQLAAEQTFGRDQIERSRRFRQKKSTHARSEWAKTHDATACRPAATILEKVRIALRGMGFRSTQAERAIATVARMHDPDEPPTLEQALREALVAATAA